MKTITLPDFLTPAQINEAVQLFDRYGADDAVSMIVTRVIEPNMAAIDKKLGQENNARYLAYLVVHVITQAKKAQAS
jgi:hypothetical protein